MKDEILAKALDTDMEIIPRYDVVLPDGTKVAENAEIVLKNLIAQNGTPYNKASMLTDETSQLIGIDPETSTPDEAFSVIYGIINSMNNSILQNVAITYQTYIGDGTYGADNPITFTVGGTPIFALITTNNGTYNRTWRLFKDSPVFTLNWNNNTYNRGVVTWGEDSVSYYDTSSSYPTSEEGVNYNAIIAYQVKQFDGPVTLTVQTANGTPVPNCKITGIYTQLGGLIFTNEQGVANGYAVSGESVTIESSYVDLADLTFELGTVTEDGLNVTKTLTTPTSGTTKIYTVSQQLEVLKDCEVDMAIVGGGTGGGGSTSSGYGQPSGSSGWGGYGGAGGKVLNVSATLSAGTYILLVGTGGTGGDGGSAGGGSGSVGTAGGDTTFGTYSSATGDSSTVPLNDSSIIVGGKLVDAELQALTQLLVLLAPLVHAPEELEELAVLVILLLAL